MVMDGDTEVVDMETSIAISDILEERERQKGLIFDNKLAPTFDEKNTRNDWVGYIGAYAGRATTCHRNESEGYDFREMMVKVGALAAAAIEAHDRGYC